MLPAARPLTVALSAGILLTTAVLLAGCGALADDTGTGRRAVAAFYPLAWVTGRVAGDEWQVANLTAPGSEPHDLSLDIAQTAEVSRADLVVLQHGFQPSVDSTVETNAADTAVIDAAEVVDLASDGGDVDPHFWQDPLLMADLADSVAARLAEIDPDRADAYADRAGEVRAELEALDADYASGLASCERTVTVVSHEAFSYLTRYGLRFEAIAGLSPGAEPTAADLARLQDLVAREGVTTVFSERLASSKMSDALARDLGLRTAVLDPLEGLFDETGGEDYLSLMRDNLAALRRANACT